ncbi:type I polyketide synthase, partial [Streptomyces sp. NPDC018693]|uniref:type I polyketide synthase n=1 Tax=unclassified Streptomyces TaxID=2593676 RepID=UPI003791D36D
TNNHHTYLKTLATTHTHGHPLNWPTINPTPTTPPTPLPTYPFQHKPYWLTPTDDNSNPLFRLQWTAFSEPATDSVSLPTGTIVLGTAHVAPGATHHEDLESLFRALDEGAPVPELVITPLVIDDADDPSTPASAYEALHRTLDLLQKWLADERLNDSRLVLITRQAVATHNREATDLTQAPLWGLARTAQTEHPDRIVLLDVDATASSHAAVAAAVDTGEPQVAVREGTVYYLRVTADKAKSEALSLTSDGTVLITGGTGALGALTARHLVTRHGITHLLLTSRRGPDAPGATQLHDELTALGAHVTITACDTTDHTALAHLLTTIPDTHPLTAVIHTAGTVDMAPLLELSHEQLDTVLRPKVDAAWNLHELTRDLDLDAFVLYSSIAGVLGAPGQANYAAANTYLDALAHHRHTLGLPATSLAWGPWAHEEGMIRHLSESAIGQITRTGFPPLSTGRALALFDEAVGGGRSSRICARLDPAALTAQAEQGVLPPLLASLVPQGSASGDRSGRKSAKDNASAFQKEYEALDANARHERLTELVRTTTATVLAHPDPDALDLGQPFKALGFDSLTTVQLRNRLSTITGLRLPTTLAFDHPTPTGLIDHLHTRLSGSDSRAPQAVTAVPAALDEAVAIVGIGCRFPGGVTTPEELWDLVAEGRDAI